jgi:hypothetical protein
MSSFLNRISQFGFLFHGTPRLFQVEPDLSSTICPRSKPKPSDGVALELPLLADVFPFVPAPPPALSTMG